MPGCPSPLPAVKAYGCGTKQGKRYLDAVAGVAVNGLGHAHPRLAKAICEQAKTLIHASNLYQIPEAGAAGARSCAQLSGMDKVFFCNSGCEANEAAIKLARLYGHNKGIDIPAIIVMEKAFHGRTLATLSATGNRKVQAGFEPLVTGFVRVPYNDLAAIEPGRRAQPERRRGAGRADAGRRRHPYARSRLSAGTAPASATEGLAADAGRSADAASAAPASGSPSSTPASCRM